MYQIWSYLKRWYKKWKHPEDFSGAPGPQENLSLRDGNEIVDARKRQGLLQINKIDVRRDGDRILLISGAIQLWLPPEAGEWIGAMAEEIKADRENRFLT